MHEGEVSESHGLMEVPLLVNNVRLEEGEELFLKLEEKKSGCKEGTRQENHGKTRCHKLEKESETWKQIFLR